jgi:hypothetical protein
MSFFGSNQGAGTEQASFWKNFQDFFGNMDMKGQGSQPPPSPTPASQQPQAAGMMQSGNQQMPNFLSQLQQLKPTPMPAVGEPVSMRGGQGANLPPGSYASQIRGFTLNYK